MLHFPWLFYLLFCLFLTSDDAAKSDMEKFQGDWTIASGTMPEEVIRKAVVSFQQDKFIIVVGESRTELRFKLNPQKQPHEIDLFKGQRLSRGIYDLQGDQLRLCYEVDGRAARPHRFEIVTETEVLLILKRRK